MAKGTDLLNTIPGLTQPFLETPHLTAYPYRYSPSATQIPIKINHNFFTPYVRSAVRRYLKELEGVVEDQSVATASTKTGWYLAKELGNWYRQEENREWMPMTEMFNRQRRQLFEILLDVGFGEDELHLRYTWVEHFRQSTELTAQDFVVMIPMARSLNETRRCTVVRAFVDQYLLTRRIADPGFDPSSREAMKWDSIKHIITAPFPARRSVARTETLAAFNAALPQLEAEIDLFMENLTKDTLFGVSNYELASLFALSEVCYNMPLRWDARAEFLRLPATFFRCTGCIDEDCCGVRHIMQFPSLLMYEPPRAVSSSMVRLHVSQSRRLFPQLHQQSVPRALNSP
ncbi:hypothetical protein M422DRAFT_271431 [Sphaerobolus stellatus SS14]|uniref:Unplaced genomic scaffold SPHSTscaffold_262, whole genome shotgun sequence n=1 Tax=Sphaerobolus stellatus (strain SS14) TaxID=990650 RepID=A0A0C9TDS2_SPHS4|nr:hypothetical protein M422DRAFT_271431 [Sphaerobolus stellatus SS14]